MQGKSGDILNFKTTVSRAPVGFTASGLLLILSAVSFCFDVRAGIAASIVFFAVLALSVSYSVFNVRAAKKFISEMNKSFAAGETDAVDAFPLPGVICDPYGNMVWCNELFESSFLVGDQSLHFRLKELLGGKSFSELIECSSFDTQYDGRKFTAYVSRLHDKNLPLASVFFVDNTHLKDTEREYNASRPFVMFIMVDNIEVLSRQLSDSKFALVTSEIESKIENWLNEKNVLFKKTSNGRFIVIGEKRSLDKLCKEKFSVLSKIREYRYNNTSVDATLSIGVGSGGDFTVCEERARKALDMSLGRGGDQAALLDGDGYTYFGGMSNRSNDNSKVSPRQTSANISNLIKKFDKVMIMGHKFSDYDAVGAAMGMLFLSETNGVEARIVVDRKKTLATELVNLVEDAGYRLFIEPEEAVKMCDKSTLVIVVDTHRPSLVESPELYEMSTAQIVIDHHRKVEDFISDAEIFYHRPAQSSTCEMVSELIEYSASASQEKLPPIIATGLLSGIVLDTRDYVLRTSKSTFEAAAFLRDNGANTVTVKKLFSVDEAHIELKNKIISAGENYNGFMIAVTDSDDNSLRIISSKAADEMLNIDGVRASFVISRFGDLINISARSLGEENVQLIMEKLGGGGHSTMAASQLKDCTLESAEAKLKEAVDSYLQSR